MKLFLLLVSLNCKATIFSFKRAVIIAFILQAQLCFLSGALSEGVSVKAAMFNRNTMQATFATSKFSKPH